MVKSSFAKHGIVDNYGKQQQKDLKSRCSHKMFRAFSLMRFLATASGNDCSSNVRNTITIVLFLCPAAAGAYPLQFTFRSLSFCSTEAETATWASSFVFLFYKVR